MDLAMQEWSTIVVGLLIVVVLLHAIKSILSSRSEKLRSAELKKRGGGDEGYGSELPNGGARVVGQRFDETAQELNETIRNGYVASRRVGNKRVVKPPAAPLGKVDIPRSEEEKLTSPHSPANAPKDRSSQGGASLGLNTAEEDVWDDRKEPSLGEFRDILMEGVEENTAIKTSSTVEENSAQGDLFNTPVASTTDAGLQDKSLEPQTNMSAVEQNSNHSSDSVSVSCNDDTPSDSNVVELPNKPLSNKQSTQRQQPEENEWTQDPEEWLILHLSAPKNYVFTGDEFFVEIEKAGFAYAKNGGFAFIEDGHEQPLFYLANGTQPGTFPPAGERDEFETDSLCFVLALPAPCDALHAFIEMDKCAEVLANVLQGQLTDDERSHYTVQTREHYRQKALQFDRNQLSRNYS